MILKNISIKIYLQMKVFKKYIYQDIFTNESILLGDGTLRINKKRGV
jgi:hypothetical protein